LDNTKSANYNVLFPSLMREPKGYALSVSTIRMLGKKQTDTSYQCTLRYVPREDTPLKLLKVAQRARRFANIVEGVLPPEEFQRMLKEGDIIVLPYQPSEFSNRTSSLLIDALLCGVPLVVQKGTWLGNLVARYECGVLAEKASSKAYVQAIELVAANHHRYRKNAISAGRQWLEDNNWATLLDFILEPPPPIDVSQVTIPLGPQEKMRNVLDKIVWRGGARMTSLKNRVLFRRFIDYLKIHYPSIITISRFVKWGLTKLKRNLFGIGGIFLLIIIALYVAGALIEPARWYLVGIASALLLLSGGLLALSYVKILLDGFISDLSDQRMQILDIKTQISNINEQVSDTIAGPFKRSDHAHIDESVLIAALLIDPTKTGTMIDVGAMHGSALSRFCHAGWQVFAFEPDPTNRKKLETKFGDKPNLTIDSRAVTDRASENMPFYSSPESPGISTLHPFRNSHKETCTVEITTIADFVRENDLHNIDYLKIDAEGYDLLILKGVPWDSIKPNVIMCEFEDSKTRSLGYTMHDMARYLVERGYKVLVSEWHPVIRYGIKHDWHRLVPYPCELDDPNAGGNLIAFLEQPNLHRIATITRRIVKVDAKSTG